jgi:hypothetical protein
MNLDYIIETTLNNIGDAIGHHFLSVNIRQQVKNQTIATINENTKKNQEEFYKKLAQTSKNNDNTVKDKNA